jgi:hypothetical protein
MISDRRADWKSAHRMRKNYAPELNLFSPSLPKLPRPDLQTTVKSVEQIAIVTARYSGSLWCGFIFCQAMEEDCAATSPNFLSGTSIHPQKQEESCACAARAMREVRTSACGMSVDEVRDAASAGAGAILASARFARLPPSMRQRWQLRSHHRKRIEIQFRNGETFLVRKRGEHAAPGIDDQRVSVRSHAGCRFAGLVRR